LRQVRTQGAETGVAPLSSSYPGFVRAEASHSVSAAAQGADIAFKGVRSAIQSLYAAKLEATRRRLSPGARAAAIRALIDEQRAALRALTERRHAAKQAARRFRAAACYGERDARRQARPS
jgi:hypothetical protein